MKPRTALAKAVAVSALALLGSLGGSVASAAAAPTAHWQILTQAAPTYFHPGDPLAFYDVVAVNDGSAPTAGPFTLKSVLPPGLVVTAVSSGAGVESPTTYGIAVPMACTVSGTTVQTVECTAEEPVPVGDRVSLKINVEVPADAVGPLINHASISGGSGGEASETTSTPVVAPSVKVPYGATFDVEVIGEEGNEETQGGGRPFAVSTILATNVARVSAAESCTPVGAGLQETPGCAELVSASKNIEIEMPAGLIGNALNVPRCSQERFQASNEVANCPVATQVGFVYLNFFGSLTAEQPTPIYNIEPPPGQPAEFGFTVGGQAHIPMFFHVREDGDYGLNIRLNELTSFDAPRIATFTIWGVPAAPAHDEKRYPEGNCESAIPGKLGCHAGVPPAPLLRMPTSCSASPLGVPLLTDSVGRPGEFAGNDVPDAIAPMSRCDRLKFAATLEANPTSKSADSPTGLNVSIHVPQNEDPAGLATPDLRDTVMKLPPNLTINPSAANGLEGCTPSQFGLTSPLGAVPIRTTDAAATCPDGSKIGTVEINSRLLDQPLLGSVYLASPYENPFQSLLAIYVVASSDKSGIRIKLAGQVEIGAEGQLTTTFKESPQLPFEDFKLSFFDGPRATLKTPPVCRTYTNETTMTPWSAPESGPAATSSNSFQISAAARGGHCPTASDQQPNSPSFEAGTESPIAGAFSPFVLRMQRDDGSQQFSTMSLDLPPGLVAQLTGIPYCPDAALAAAAGKTGAEERASASCPPGSQVGVVNVGAGAGPSPYYVQGRAYLTGPYREAPLGLAIVTPAVAGPFDLGTVVVRSAIEVDPYTAQVSVKTDAIPTQLKGIPLDLRSIAVRMDRSNFTLNPTNCEVMNIGGSMTSRLGQTAKVTNRFQVGGCDQLKFAPRIKLRLKGKTKRSGHPALKAVVTYPQGASANIARAQVGLPHSEFLDQGNLDKVCTQADLRAGTCPAKSIYGRAKAWTPLLEKPLQGPVYLAVGFGYKLPALVADLNGQIRILLKGRVDTNKRDGIRNTFETVPDAPVSRFVLEMKGGPKYGLLENSENICLKKQRASVRFVAANGKFEQLQPRIGNDCKAKQKKGKRGGRR